MKKVAVEDHGAVHSIPDVSRAYFREPVLVSVLVLRGVVLREGPFYVGLELGLEEVLELGLGLGSGLGLYSVKDHPR